MLSSSRAALFGFPLGGPKLRATGFQIGVRRARRTLESANCLLQAPGTRPWSVLDETARGVVLES
jgi:hypothetical protein